MPDITPGQQPAPVLPSNGAMRPVDMREVEITGGYWHQLQELNGHAVIDHALGWMERVGWLGNFDAAREGRLPADRTGREFADSEVYKLLEAMAWEIARTGDRGMDERFRAIVARIAAAQEPDGYLNTNFGRPGQAPRYSDMEWGHELYCYGHLIQAAVARGRTRGVDELVRIALRAADHVCATFGAGGREAVCGHPEIEVALVELSRYAGEEKYLRQAQLFLQRRGHGLLGECEFGPEYFQDDVAIAEAQVLRGHAVRALYLTAGAVDAAVEAGDGRMLATLERQMARTVARRTYLTGGMGAHHEGESFGADYELPPDRAYSETCAGVGAVMVSQRLLLAGGGSHHADLIERVLYNVVATSPAADGHAFFYTNTLHKRSPGEAVATDRPAPRAAASMRAPWFAVSCCPPNVARTLASLGAYLATKDDDGVQLQQYATSQIHTSLDDGCPVGMEVSTDYPHDGRVRVRITQDATRAWTLSLRVPGWAGGAAVLRAFGEETVAEAGYAQVRRQFRAGDEVVLDLPVRPRWTRADHRVDAVRGQVAVQRGPVVMCLESPDLGADVATAAVATGAEPIERGGEVFVPVRDVPLADTDWPYGSALDGAAAAEVAEAAEAAETAEGGAADCRTRTVRLIPYHAWGNRGPSTMRVWIPVAGV